MNTFSAVAKMYERVSNFKSALKKIYDKRNDDKKKTYAFQTRSYLLTQCAYSIYFRLTREGIYQ